MKLLLAAGAILWGCYLGTTVNWSSADIDFTPFYAGSKLGPDRAYNPAEVRREVTAIGETIPARHYYIRIPALGLAYKPFAVLPYETARVAWRLALIAGLVACVLLFPARWELLIAALCSPAVVWSVWQGQDTTFTLVAFVASLWLYSRGKPFAAGLCFALCAAKPHLYLFVPFVLLAKREYRYLLGGAAAAAGMALVSIAYAGLAWIPQYFAITQNTAMHPNGAYMPGLRSLSEAYPLAYVGVVLLAVVGVVLASRMLDTQTALAVAAAVGVVVNTHSYAVDCVVLLPLVALAVRSDLAGVKIPAALLASPVPLVLLIAGHPEALRGLVLAVCVAVIWARESSFGYSHSLAHLGERGINHMRVKPVCNNSL